MFKFVFEACSYLMRHYLAYIIKDDRMYLYWLYFFKCGVFPDLDNPKTFGEKIQWLKLNNRKSEYTMMVDKYAVKEYVIGCIGEQYVIPTLYVWDSVDAVNVDYLPEQFVLKTTYGGGSCGVVICKDKLKFNLEDAKKELRRSDKYDIYPTLREWPYKNVPRRIIAEQFMQNENDEELLDYKFFCFNGIPRLCQVISERRTEEKIDFFDMEWNRMEGLIGLVGLNPKVKNSTYMYERPKTFETMKGIATRLSMNIPFVRIDMYEINGKCYFGEITFYPASGMGRLKPEEWNRILGDWISLPQI